MARFQTGSLQRKKRKSGDIWVFRHRRQRSLDGKWVEATPIKIGPVRQYPSREAAERRAKECILIPIDQPSS
jgi:hypothetical protein